MTGNSPNPFQLKLLRSYPNVQHMSIDPDDPVAVERDVATGRTGDTLFDFLWIEMKEAATDKEEALRLLERAMEDIQAVRDAIEADPSLDASAATTEEEDGDDPTP